MLCKDQQAVIEALLSSSCVGSLVVLDRAGRISKCSNRQIHVVLNCCKLFPEMPCHTQGAWYLQ